MTSYTKTAIHLATTVNNLATCHAAWLLNNTLYFATVTSRLFLYCKVVCLFVLRVNYKCHP